MDALSQGVWDRDALSREALPSVRQYLADRRVVPPSPTILLRLVKTARRQARLHHQNERAGLLAGAMGVSLSSSPIAQRVRAHHLLRLPSVSRGKPALPKLEQESTVRRDIEATLGDGPRVIRDLLAHPGAQEGFELVERTYPKDLRRRETREVLLASPYHYAVRHRQAVDAILAIIVTMVRILRSRVENLSEERLDDSSRAFFERKGKHLAPLRRAVLSVLAGREREGLRPFRPVLQELERQGVLVQSGDVYFELLGRRGTRMRQIGRHLKGIPLEGMDDHARAVVRALEEVLRFLPFRQPVPREIRRPLRFLAVSDRQLSSRRVFEGVTLTTLSDLLAVGRVTSPASRRYGNHWDAARVVGEETCESLAPLLERARKDLREAWAALREAVPGGRVVERGHLVARRPSRKWLEEEEERHRVAQQRFVADLPQRSIPDVILAVHRSTGMLDAFRAPRSARHRLGNEERIRSAIAVVAGRGTNIGLEAMTSLLGPMATSGRLWNFDEVYVTRPALLEANRTVLEEFERRGLGRPWGSGETGAADGKSFKASEANLLSRRHFRHRVMGVTLHWIVRDDWMAPYVGVIGNHEWESWFLLAPLLEPLGGRPLRWVAGDTHGQHLALWGLSWLLGKEVRARFRSLGQVKLYGDDGDGPFPLEGVEPVRWGVVERALPSLERLVSAIRGGQLSPTDILRTWNVFDESGRNVVEALRELGKAVRTRYVLEYACSEKLRREVREACNRMETWNSGEEALFHGHGGRMKTTNDNQREINALCLQLVQNSLVFYNVEMHGRKLRQIPGAVPLMWKHIRLYGEWRFTSRAFSIGRQAKK